MERIVHIEVTRPFVLYVEFDDGVAIIVATPTEEHTTQAEAALQAFVQDMLPAVEASLNDSAGGR